MFWLFGLEVCGILAPPPGIRPIHPELEGKALTTELASKIPHIHSIQAQGIHTAHLSIFDNGVAIPMFSLIFLPLSATRISHCTLPGILQFPQYHETSYFFFPQITY